MQKTIVSTLAALALTAVATAAAAETLSVPVAYGDLDLASAAGMATLERRIQTASMKICGAAEVRNIHDGFDRERCVRSTKASVTMQIARVTRSQPVLALNTHNNIRR